MPLLKEIASATLQGLVVAGGAAGTSALTTHLSADTGGGGYQVMGKIPLSMAAGTGLYAAGYGLRKMLPRGLSNMLIAMGHGAWATYGSNLGYGAVQQGGLTKDLLFGVGSAPSAHQYGRRFNLANRKAG